MKAYMLHYFVGGGLLGAGAIALLSSIIYGCQGSELWWPRFAFGMILFGLWYAGQNKTE